MNDLWFQQIKHEAKDRSIAAKVRAPLHRLGVLAALLHAVIAVDPWGYHGLYSSAVTPWIMDNIASLIVRSHC